MSGPPRVQGNLLVVAVVGITVAAVGYGTVYLPFYADKERLRGVRKDERRIPDVARKEIMAHLEKEEAYRREWESQLAPVAPPKQQQQQQQSEMSTSEKPVAVAEKPKSMWKMLDFSSKKQKQQPQYDENTPLWKVFEEQQRQTQKQEEEDAGIGSDDGPAIRPDQMRLSDKARNQIIEAIKASEEEDRRQEILKAKKGKACR